MTSALFHTSVGQGKNTIGVGWYYISDDKGTLNTGVFSAFDPLKEDDLFPYNDQNNCELFFIDSHFEYGSFSTDIAFGYGDNKAIDGYSRELDLWLYYNFTNHVHLGGYLILVDSDSEDLLSYNQFGASLTYSF